MYDMGDSQQFFFPNGIYFLAKFEKISKGTGNIIVLFFSAEILLSVWRYLSCRAPGLAAIISLAALRAELAFCSPSAAITWINCDISPTFMFHSYSPLLWLLVQPQLQQPLLSVTELVASHLFC